MAEGRISKRSVDALTCPPGRDRVFLWDDDLAGFGVIAFPEQDNRSGKKAYVVQFRKDGRSRRLKIGNHGALTPDQAREEAKKLLGSVAQGIDPTAARKAARGVPTFREIADAFMARHVAAKKRQSTFEAYQVLLKTHVLPAIGAIRVPDLRRSHLSKLHHDMAATPGAANRAVSVVSAAWNWASKEWDDPQVFIANPAKGLVRFAEEGKERFLTQNELGRLGDALSRAETVGLPYKVDDARPKARHAAKPESRLRQLDPFAIAAIRLLILTGARLREILHAEWSEIDLQRGLLNLPDAKSKTGRKSIYLSAAALAILADLPRIRGNSHIIAGAMAGKPRADLQRPWSAVIETAELPGLRIHDLRHTFASLGAGASLGLPIIGRLLGHSQPATTARYAHLDADPMRRAVDTIGSAITAAMGGQPKKDALPIKKRFGM